MSAESLNEALVQWFADDLGRAFRALERHRPDAHGKCRGCATQLGSTPFPCRISRVAVFACETVAARNRAVTTAAVLAPTTPVDWAFQHAIAHNAASQTVPLRAVSRTASTAPGNSGRHRQHTGEDES